MLTRNTGRKRNIEYTNKLTIPKIVIDREEMKAFINVDIAQFFNST